jgi:hypothetical protein
MIKFTNVKVPGLLQPQNSLPPVELPKPVAGHVQRGCLSSLWTERPGKIFLFCRGKTIPVVNRPGHEADHPRPYGADVKNAHSYTWYFLVFGFTHGVCGLGWLFFGLIFKGQLTFVYGTDKEFRNVVVSQPKPHTVDKPKNQETSK